MDTDKNKAFLVISRVESAHFLVSYFASYGKATCPVKSVLSVFICVHPWFLY